jgi:serine/threonine protein kinase/tricorn protease-like protein
VMAPSSEASLLNSLLHYEESLRAGRVPDTLVLETDPDLLKKVTVGQKALQILEAVAPRRVKAIPSWAPDRIGRFEILSVLGSGGFAVVYLARDPDLNRQIALKVPRPHSLMNSELRRRFVTEAKAVASLDHPNIISVFETGEDGDLPYLACAWCEGPTLSEWLTSRKTSVSPRLAAEIVRTLTLAVHYSHSRGILHRDIKPGNVFLFPDQSQPGADFPFVPRLGDFGLAKLLEAETAETMTSQLIGTPRYLAPEIIQSSSGSASEASDIYSLGATLYTLLVGRPPFDSSSTPETLRLIVESDPIAPHMIDPGIDQDLSLVCLKCLEKQPPQRYDSANALADDLTRFLSGHPVKARRPSMWRALVKWGQRRPVIASLTLVSVFLTCCLLFLAVSYTRSLKKLQGDLLASNRQLRVNVAELDKAVQQSESLRTLADQNYENAENLLLAADIQIASLAWKSGDAQGAFRILSKHKPLGSAGQGVSHFAWRYLNSRVTFPNETILNGGQSIWWLQESPLNGEILSAGSHGAIRAVSKNGSANDILFLQATKGELSSFHWSDDRTILVTTGDNGHIAIWDAATHHLLHLINVDPQMDVSTVAFLPGTHQFVSCEDRSELGLWDADAGKLLRRIPTPHEGAIEHMTMSPDRSSILTTGSDGNVCLFRLEDFERVIRIGFDSVLTMSHFTPNGKRVVVAGRDGGLRLCDLANGQILTEFKGLDAIHAVACSRDGVIAAGDRGGAVTLFDADAVNSENAPESWIPLRRLGGHQKPISYVLWQSKKAEDDQGAETLLTADRAGVIRRWRISPRNTTRELSRGSEANVLGPNWLDTATRESAIVIPTDHDPGFAILDVNSGNGFAPQAADGQVTAITMAANSGTVIAGDRQGRLIMMPRESSESPGVIPVFEASSVYRLAVDSLGRTAVAQSYDDELAVVNTEDGGVLLRLSNQSASTISPDGQWIITASHGLNTLQVREIQNLNATPYAELSAHHTTVSAILISSDGRQLVSVSHDRTLCLWDGESLKLRHRLTGHIGKIRATAISADDRVVATGDDKGVVKLWDVVVGRELLQLEPLPIESVAGMKFTMDGNTLVVWDQTGHTIVIPGSLKP